MPSSSSMMGLSTFSPPRGDVVAVHPPDNGNMDTIRLTAAASPLKYLLPVLVMGLLTMALVEFAMSHSPMATSDFASLDSVRIVAHVGVGVLTVATAVAALRLRRQELQSVVISPHGINISWHGAFTSVPREGIKSIIVGKDLVLLGSNSVELARMHNSIEPAQLTSALRARGYPSPVAHDPHDRDFKDVKSLSTILPTDVGQLLAVRGELLRLSDAGQAEALRRRIVRLGFNVRDHGKLGLLVRQEVRPNGIRPAAPRLKMVA